MSEDGAAGHKQEMNLELLVQQQREIQAKLSMCPGLSIHGMGTGRKKESKATLGYQWETGPWTWSSSKRQSGSGLCVSDSKERIRNLKGLVWSQRRTEPHLEGSQGGNEKGLSHTGDFRLEQL